MAVPTNLHIEGRAMVQGREIRRPAVPADDMMQAFAYRFHLVPANDLKVAVLTDLSAATRRESCPATPVNCPRAGTPASMSSCLSTPW